MLGIPVITATAGLLPTTVAMLGCCIFMTTTAFLLLEATLWFGGGASLISMAKATLGNSGSALTWLLFLFLFYCLGIAYTAGAGELLANGLSVMTELNVPHTIGYILSSFGIGLLVYAGTVPVDYLNRILIIGLIASYCALIAVGASHVQSEPLLYSSWSMTFATVPILLISFGFHNMIPSLTSYVNYDKAKMRTAILCGVLGAFIIYLLWEIVILGLLPVEGRLSLDAVLAQGDMVTDRLHQVSGIPWIVPVANAFAFFAITTSYLANSLSFVDFLADGLQISAQGQRRILLCSLVLLPPLLVALITPNLFLKALHLAGGTATVILFGIIPALIVWRGRRQHGTDNAIVPGGKFALIVVILLSCLVLGLEITHQWQS
jgi:tyrosine-specific transport protein